MRICIISDLHANIEALSALPADYDDLWVLGDLVNYGPDPAATIEFVRARAAVVIRGNHDNAIGRGVDYGCSPRFRTMAAAVGQYTNQVLNQTEKEFLRKLPARAYCKVDGRIFFLCHATPSNLLYEYRTPESPLWACEEDSSAGADVILAGHTHLPFVRTFGSRVVANPGSLGQSKAGDARARYALWHDGHIELKAYEYPVQTTVGKIFSLPLSDEVKRDLVDVLQNGRAQ
jgi:putative phosphoesterase